MPIALTCPQCGAEVELTEEATVFNCAYCGSILKPTGRHQVQAFFIKPRGTGEEVGQALTKTLSRKYKKSFQFQTSHLIYAPYWYVKGMLFHWQFTRRYQIGPLGGLGWEDRKELQAFPWERTFPAFDPSTLPLHSLGIRSQVLKLWPFHKPTMGTEALLVEQNVTLREAVLQVRQSIETAEEQETVIRELEKSALIGERYALLYFPFFAVELTHKQTPIHLLLDALAHRVLQKGFDRSTLGVRGDHSTIPYQPLRFLPFKCPNCGWDFPFRPMTVVHLCRVCGRGWVEKNGEYREVSYTISHPPQAAGTATWTYLPFWRFLVEISTPDRVYKTLHDFYTLFPLLRPRQRVKDHQPISFYIPAFKVKNVQLVDKLATRLTYTQPPFPGTKSVFEEAIQAADVWLSLREAKEMASLLLYSLTPRLHKKTKKIVKVAKLRFRYAHLFWLPFQEKGMYLREIQTDCAVQKNALEI